MSDIVIGGIYEHYKGKHYKVIGVAHHSETLEKMVVYEALYDTPDYGRNALWVRPLSMFVETVMIDGVEKARFKFIEKQ
jgi:hypothetical protein